MSFRERMYPPWWAYLAVPAAFATALTELAIGVPPLASAPGYLVAVAAGLIVPWLAGRIVVSVDGDEFRVDDAHLPGWAIADISVLDQSGRRRLLGLDAQAHAFVVGRPWITGGVRVDLADPDDPTPYWFVSCRQPDRLAEALRTLRDRAVSPV
jgi:hypothetical protein